MRDDIFSDNDHRYIVYTLSSASSQNARLTPTGWAVRRLDRAKIEAKLKIDAANGRDLTRYDGVDAERAAAVIGDYLFEVSDATMPRRGISSPRWSVFWWSDEIADLRKSCIASFRAYQQAGRRGAARVHLMEGFRAARKLLRVAIRKAQEVAWRKLVDSVEADP